MIRIEKTNNKIGESTISQYFRSETHVNSSLIFDQFLSNIQEIVDNELMLEFIYI